MGHIRVLICHVDDPASDQMTELAAFDLPHPDPARLQAVTALDELETTTHETGNAILRRVLQAQWEVFDRMLAEQSRQHHSLEAITFEGHEPITVASRFGTIVLSRQVCLHSATQHHVAAANAVLPLHHGIIKTLRCLPATKDRYLRLYKEEPSPISTSASMRAPGLYVGRRFFIVTVC